jgi:GNAT superfamily N-acetyltransferase
LGDPASRGVLPPEQPAMPQPHPELTLVRATPAQLAIRWRLHHQAWGAGFELPLYLQREAALAEHEVIASGLTAWLLVQGDGEVVASCESHASEAWTVDADGHVRRESMETVASVLVEPRLRGCGYAMALMRALREQQRQAGLPLSALYSDVGPQLYRRSGYMLHPAVESTRPVAAASTHPAHVDLVGIGEVGELLAQDARELAAWLGGSSAPAFAEVPRVDRVLWFSLRSQYRAWARGQAPPQAVGARAGEDGWCLWSSDAVEPVLHVLLWRPHGVRGAQRLTDACLAHAAQLGLREVVWWDADRDTGLDPYRQPQLQPPGAIRRERSSSLPMVSWLDGSRGFPLVWMAVERLGWR